MILEKGKGALRDYTVDHRDMVSHILSVGISSIYIS